MWKHICIDLAKIYLHILRSPVLKMLYMKNDFFSFNGKVQQLTWNASKPNVARSSLVV